MDDFDLFFFFFFVIVICFDEIYQNIIFGSNIDI